MVLGPLRCRAGMALLRVGTGPRPSSRASTARSRSARNPAVRAGAVTSLAVTGLPVTSPDSTGLPVTSLDSTGLGLTGRGLRKALTMTRRPVARLPELGRVGW